MTECCSCGLSRRHFITSAALGSAALLWSGLRQPLADENDSKDEYAPKKGVMISPDEALKRLKEGNKRFLDDETEHPHLDTELFGKIFAGGQHPFATIIACSDSRVPVEKIFDQGVGNLFTIRNAGNVIHGDETGSAEYGAVYLGTPLILVMGHTKCGAVTAVGKGKQVGGSIPKLMDNIEPAVARSQAKGLTGDALIDDAIRENVKESIHHLLVTSEKITTLVRQGKVKIIGAVYHIENGRVEWL